jgi:hypothetical protein
MSSNPTPPTPPAPVFSDAHIGIFIKVFIGSLIVVGILYRVLAETKELFDYLSYSLPCASGIVAGGTIISANKNSDRSYYLGAVTLLIMGFICYLESHIDSNITLLVWIIFLGAAAVFSLFCIAVKKDYSGNSEGLWGLLLITIFTILIVAELGVVAVYRNDLKDKKQTLPLCKCQPTNVVRTPLSASQSRKL